MALLIVRNPSPGSLRDPTSPIGLGHAHISESRTRKLRETPHIGSLLVLSGPEGQVSLSPCFDSQIGRRVHALARKRGPRAPSGISLDSRLRGNERNML